MPSHSRPRRCWLAIFLLSFGLNGILHAARSHDGQTPDRASESIERYEILMNSYFRGAAPSLDTADINRRINEFNTWIQTREAELKARRAALDREFAALEKNKEELDALSKTLAVLPDPSNEGEVRRHNEKVAVYNAAAEKYQVEGEKYRKHQDEYNAGVEEYNRDMARRQSGLEKEKARQDSLLQRYNEWFESKQDQDFFRDLNRTLARILDRKRLGAGGKDIDSSIARLRQFRRELGQWAANREREKDNGLIVVEAIFPGGETSYLILDTGASRVSLTPEMVAIIGRERSLGEEIETSVAGGLTATGRALMLSRLEVAGQTLENVEAMVLPASETGIDGLLGRSFLKHFILTIDDHNDPPIALIRKDGSR